MHLDAERRLWVGVPRQGCGYIAYRVRDVISFMLADDVISSRKEALATLRKWSDEGCYDYGVSLDLGWRVPGREPARLKGAPSSCPTDAVSPPASSPPSLP